MFKATFKAKAQFILDELNAGADFATLAEEKSLTLVVRMLADLGWIERMLWTQHSKTRGFRLENIGDTTGSATDFGYHHQARRTKSISSSALHWSEAAEIKTELLDQHAVDQFYEQQINLKKKCLNSQIL